MYSMRKKINVNSIFIFIIIFLNLNCFYLVDYTKIPIDDICLVVELLFFCFVFITNANFKIKFNTKYLKFYLCIPLLIITSSLAANVNYVQPVLLGIQAQRHWLFSMLMYFPINTLLVKQKISIKNILNIVDIINVFFILILIVQFYLGSEYKIMYANSNVRYDTIRLYFSSAFLMISCIVHFQKCLKKFTYYDSAFFFIILFVFIEIGKSRMFIVSVVLSLVVGVLLFKGSAKKKLAIIFISIISCFAFLRTDIGYDLLNFFMQRSSEQNTSEIREFGRDYYIDTNAQNINKIVFGSGFANMNWRPAVIYTKSDQQIGINDNGIIGMYFYYGLSIVIWAFFFYLVILRDSYLVFKKTKNFSYICYALVSVFGLFTLFPGCYENNIAFSLMLALLNNEISK